MVDAWGRPLVFDERPLVERPMVFAQSCTALLLLCVSVFVLVVFLLCSLQFSVCWVQLVFDVVRSCVGSEQLLCDSIPSSVVCSRRAASLLCLISVLTNESLSPCFRCLISLAVDIWVALSEGDRNIGTQHTAKPSQVKSSQAKPSQAKPSQANRSQAKLHLLYHQCSNAKPEPRCFTPILDTVLASAGARNDNNCSVCIL